MKLYEITEPKGIDSLRLTERPTPTPGLGEVLVRVRATSLNYRDLALINGGLARMMKLPLIPVSDGAGDVAEVGPGVRRLKQGDRVAGVFTQGWPPDRPMLGHHYIIKPAVNDHIRLSLFLGRTLFVVSVVVFARTTWNKRHAAII